MKKSREIMAIENSDPPLRYEDSIASRISPEQWEYMRIAQLAWEMERKVEEDALASIHRINQRILNARAEARRTGRKGITRPESFGGNTSKPSRATRKKTA